MNTKEILEKLCACPSPSGDEESAANEFLRIIAPFSDKTEIDRAGNGLAFKFGGGKRLLIEAHADEVGLIITEINGGFLSFRSVGGIDLKTLPGSRVTVLGEKPTVGVIGLKPPHLQVKGEDRSLKIADMVIDTGLSDAQEKVKVGDTALLETPFTQLTDDFVAARCLDNRACLAAIAAAASEIDETPFDICFAATSGEETGMRGAKALARDFLPDISISLDVTFGEGHSVSEDSFPLDKPTLCISPSLSRPLTEALFKAAELSGVSVSTETAPGSSGTNAWAAALGSPSAHTALISVPIKYMHTSVEVCSVKCIEAAAKLVRCFAEGGCGFAE